MSEQKKIPNPDGRKGCEAHRNLIEKIVDYLTKKGFRPSREHRIKLNNGNSRYVDVAGTLDENLVELHQVGVQTQ